MCSDLREFWSETEVDEEKKMTVHSKFYDKNEYRYWGGVS